MLLIRVVSFRERPVGREVAARFGEAGGTIGRGEASTLVLPDPERHISRTHATIAFQASGFVITDNGTKNPIILNGRPMGPGIQMRLGDGDQIKLGGYTLEVNFAPRSASQMSPAGTGTERVSGAPKDPWSKVPDPFADILNPVEPSASRPDSGRREPVISPFGKSSPRPDPVADLQGREPSIDDVLGGRNSAGPDPLGVGPQPGRVFLPPDAMDPVDPLEAMGGVRKPIPPPTIPDHDQELVSHYVPPMAKLDPILEPKAELLPPAALPSFPPPSAQPLTSSASRVASERGETASLLRALLAGAGIPDADQPKTLTPEMMEAVGGLLREAVQGTLDLLRARGLMKSEMRADVTMIMPLDNNPLKFSPSVEAALVHLLAPHVRGFMPPVRAMKAAYDDLRAHQLGFLAGMRAALDEVLSRFAPEELGKRLSDPTVLDSLLPMNRKAKRWDLFVEHYGEIVAEAREDFNAAFGKAFLRAYEAQVKRLRAEGGR